MLPNFQFILDAPDAGALIFGEYEPWLVILSVLVAIFTSSVALETAAQISRSKSAHIQYLLLAVGSFAMGGGVWAMHFIGMLAFKICGTSGYNIPITLLSMIPSILASAVALKLLSATTITFKRMMVGGVLIGSGIGAMHYSGMSAMEVSSDLYYDPWIFALSILVAVGLSMLGIWVRFGLMRFLPNLSRTAMITAGGGVLGLAVSGMHYTGMEAVVFVGNSEDCVTLSIGYWTFLAISIAGVSIVIALSSLGLTLLLRYRDFNTHLRRERIRQAAIIRTAVDGIILIDGLGNILEFNPACEQMFGYERAEVIGQNVKILMPDPYCGEHDEYLSNYHKTGERRIIGIGREAMGLRKDGESFPIEVSVGEASDADGNLYIGVLRDITERKQMEEKLLDALTEAEQAGEAKTAFLTNMSHEIRTPMNAIIGFVELVLSQELQDEQRRHLKTVHQSARSLLRLLNDILNTAKLDQNSLDLEIRPFSLPVFLDEMLSIFNNNAKAKGLDWQVTFPSDIPPFYFGDITRIRQILVNLIGNAIKFTLKGHVTLKVERINGDLVFEIKDTGIGIPADKIEDIFNPFAQSDASISRRFGGIGLGTSIARQLVTLMSGTIEVESELDKGSVFTVSLPLETSDYLEDDEFDELPITFQIAPRKILVAEDIQANAELLTVRLEGAGHKVTWVTNGTLAIEAVQENHFDLVLMDVQMPENDGLAATKEIRNWERETARPPIPIIALTAGAFQEDRIAAKAVGMDGFVTKPVQFNLLFAEIARVLEDESVGDLTPQNSENSFASLGSLEGIDLKQGLERWVNARAYNDNLLAFSERFEDVYLLIRNAIQQDKLGEAKDLAHRLRGVAANLSITRVARAAEQVEKRLKSEEGYESALSDLFSSLTQALSEIERLRVFNETHHPSGEIKPISEPLSPGELEILISTLRQGLSEGSCDESVFEALRAGLGALAEDEAFRDLDEAIRSFDFDPAIEKLDALAAAVCPPGTSDDGGRNAD